MTFPGVQVPLPPQLVLALVAWSQGQILAVMGQVCDVATVSAASAAERNQLMLQLGIILEPSLTEPKAFCSSHTWRPPKSRRPARHGVRVKADVDADLMR